MKFNHSKKNPGPVQFVPPGLANEPSLGLLLAQTSIADVTEMMFGLMFIPSMSCTRNGFCKNLMAGEKHHPAPPPTKMKNIFMSHES